MPKRKSKNKDSVASKKLKSCCYFPLQVLDIVRRIAYYLEGDHLKNFKLVCKKIEKITREMSCAILITKENFDRTCVISGYHIIKLNKENEEIYGSMREWWYPKVKYLTIDYCGMERGGEITQENFASKFRELQFLRIIRCVEEAKWIFNFYTEISTLEIYSSKTILLEMCEKIKNVRLCSMENAEDKATIHITVPNIDYTGYAWDIKCFGRKRIILRSGFYAISDILHDFEPRSEFLP